MIIRSYAYAGLLLPLVTFSHSVSAKTPGRYDAIHSGTPWIDQRGLPVSAHGGGITKDGDTYYLFGEAHRDMTNAFAGFNCYSSKDLANWRFESVALPVQQSGALGPNTVGERPKVMRSPTTGKFVMFMHADAIDYRGQFVGYATAMNITGPYAFQGPLLFNGKPIAKWDMGAFQDEDGTGYVLLHGGDIYRLADDYRSVREHINKAMAHGFESPAMFRKGKTYYFLGSNLTGWERNDNYYFTATSLNGPWTRQGTIAPEGTLTWNSQTTFVLPIADGKKTTYMFMGDRWSYPRQASAATYVWQPLIVTGTKITMPVYRDAWRLDAATGAAKPGPAISETIVATDKRVRFAGTWRQEAAIEPAHHVTDESSSSFSVTFTGTQASLISVARPDGGYAYITLRDRLGKEMISSTVDMYSKYPVSGIKFVTPLLARGTYTISASVVGDGWYWRNKKGERSGSAGHAITFERAEVRR
ncbi:family 43 glycosylhydrolase [Sphingomonas sp. CFBP 8760]|uniref:family 43 glycosylhydrolase n=2 Tax=Sphingomonas sp. CFBP 8760 TaxID=2775282 RepID=UPI00177A98BD|nr:family 43 glycosylhydrolase [Sphingomonas sp. CFBP 8760]MBD8546760.1 family 43 glycosylhydrolase [Sphingomonas sp. CFBP 8760]